MRNMGFVMASTAPVLVTVPNVPILEAGVEYQLSTGPATFTPEDLRDAVTAANEDFSIPSPRHKIGHIDPRYNDTSTFDGSAAFGKYVNLRLGENGMVVYADLVGCPKWLADIMPAAFPSRSIEGFWNVQSQAGKSWNFVLSAVAALGVNWPGVTVLEDLPLWYGAEVPEGAVIDEELVAAASGEGGVAVKSIKQLLGKADTAASANLDDVRRAFYGEYVEANQDAFWWWIRAVLVDPNELVVEDDETGQLYKMSFSAGSKGEITFGEPEEVRIEYVPDSSKKAAAGFVAAALSVDRQVLGSFNNRAESGAPDRSANASGGAMDPKLIRQRLGLAETASDDEVESALAELRQLTGEETPISALPPQQHPGTGDRGNDTVLPPAPSPDAATPESVQNAPANDPNAAPVEDPGPPAQAAGLPPGMVAIDQEMLRQLQAGAQAGLALQRTAQENTVQSLVAAAISDGRIPPARAAAWTQYLGTDFEGGKAALASLQPGLVPLQEVGHNGVTENGELAGPAYPEHWLPEVARAANRSQAIASGQIAGPARRIAREEGVR